MWAEGNIKQETREHAIVNSKIEFHAYRLENKKSSTNEISSGIPSHFITAVFDLLSVFSGVSIFANFNSPNASVGFPCAVHIMTFSFCSCTAAPVPTPTSLNPRATSRGATPFYAPRSITH